MNFRGGASKRAKRLLCILVLIQLLAGCGARSDARQTEPAAFEAEKNGEENALAAAADSILSGMSPEEKAWQMLVLFPQQITGSPSTGNGTLWASGYSAHAVGGVVFDGENMRSETELKSMLAAAGSVGKIAPLLCVDEEGGAVARLSYSLNATTKFRPMYSYRSEGKERAYENARTIGSEISGFGFNVDFAPVADVWTNPENTVIGRRAYSDDPEEAAELVAEAVRGFHDGGVACVLKHFPGHGDTAEDSHMGEAVCVRSLAELEECELLPFAAGIDAGADMVMIGHITLPALDPERPATLSRAVVTGLLREKLGFDGVVITDAMRMGALSAAGMNAASAAVMAVEAGCDLILAPEDPDAVVRALLEEIEEERLDQSVRRILMMKLRRGIVAEEE